MAAPHRWRSPRRITGLFFLVIPPPPRPTLFPYTTLFRSLNSGHQLDQRQRIAPSRGVGAESPASGERSEEHTSELQSRRDLVCRLLLEKKKKMSRRQHRRNTKQTKGKETMQQASRDDRAY